MDKKYTGSERRQFPRIKIPLFIFYRLETDKPFAIFKAITQDIGGQGLMFETEKPVPIGSNLYLEIYQPSVRYKDLIFVLSALAKVIWLNKKEDISEKEKGVNEYQIGIEFIDIQEEGKGKIIEYIERAKKGE